MTDKECFVVNNDTINSITFRKNKLLSKILLPDNLLFIGDAAFSFCMSLRQICIPASVQFVGVAAFCKSGLEEVVFKGVPKIIEPSIFIGCKHLKKVLVPMGQKQHFCKVLGIDRNLIFEGTESYKDLAPVTKKIEVRSEMTKRINTFSYNNRYFYWKSGDSVTLNDVFSGPITFNGSTSYQFRRKALFVFMHPDILDGLDSGSEYEIPANAVNFMRKYQEKYNSRIPRIFLFKCDSENVAYFYDEVKLVRANKNSITIKSLLR
jgi:hypothetical protein